LGNTLSSHEAILAQNRANYYGVGQVQSEKEIAEFAKQVFAKEQKLLSGGLPKLDAVTAIYIIKNWKRFNFFVNERGDVIFKDKDFEKKKTIVVQNNKTLDTKASTNVEKTIEYLDNINFLQMKKGKCYIKYQM
jgi:primosomal protein N''